MIKGFLALFTTGLIFKPMLLLGGIIGITSYIMLDGESLKLLYTNWQLYALFFIISCLYVYFFKKTYLENTSQTDWKETSKTMLSEFFVLCFSFVIGMLLASFFDFSLPESKTQTNDLQKQVEDIQNNLLNQIR